MKHAFGTREKTTLMRLQFSIGLTSNPRTWPVIDGHIKPDAIDLVPTVLHPSELFWRQLRFAEFDVAEMSVSSLMMARSKGDDRFVGIPVFTTRRFFHTGILVRRAARIETPADLKGKRVGVPEYQQTAALWARGVLQHEFGVAPKDMEFWMERPPSHSHGGATGFVPPPGVTVNRIPLDKNIGSMMLAGELDAVLFYLVDPNLIDRSTADLANHPDIKTLFPDPLAEGIRYYRKTGLYPINHGMVIRRELAEKHPWAVLNILKAFERANAAANRQRMEHTDYHVETGLLPADARKSLQVPIVSHGIAANRAVLETVAQYSQEQGLTPRLMKLDELFAASAMAQ
jgi:4,5-dihydroxyphthalate decarboxylase